MNIGWGELVFVLVIALLLFGPSRLPGMGRAIGRTLREFKRGLHDGQHNNKDSSDT